MTILIETSQTTKIVLFHDQEVPSTSSYCWSSIHRCQVLPLTIHRDHTAIAVSVLTGNVRCILSKLEYHSEMWWYRVDCIICDRSHVLVMVSSLLAVHYLKKYPKYF